MACSCADQKEMCDNNCASAPKKVPKSLNFNQDPAWHTTMRRYEPVIRSIAAKYCVADEDLQQDLMQDARMALLVVRPEDIRGYDEWQQGEIDDRKWQKRVDSYCGNVIRNSILSTLDSYATGNWYIGRTRHIRDRVTGKAKKVHMPPRYSSLDELVDEFGFQIDEEGKITWPDHSDDGLLGPNSREE
jgi:DNA-directed RNA polymerase specialized sigma subunit